ncbi:MAG TPA: Hsp70 family protein, partial [Blastocatellia bacterium]|nr:Hsp70 family protein [Blastocatellia bacterium]
IRSLAELHFGAPVRSALVGRPVRFVGAESDEDDAFAVGRLRAALGLAGFESIEFELEPVAAAYHDESTLDHDELILIGDFGGGTSDFSLLRLGPAFRTTTSGERTRGTRARGTREILGTDGVAIAGNDFDSVLVRHLVAPKLGFGTEYRSLGKLLPVPRWIYKEFERWHYLSFLKTRQTMEMLESIKTEALEPEKIEQLIHVIDEELGFQLYRAIERTKVELSARQSSTFVFKDWRVEITEEVTRSQFEALISSYLMEMTDCIDRLLGNCNAAPAEVDSVFMTGGSSFVPAVRLLFAEKFGADKLRGGGELTSVAEGLALRALSLNKQAL